MSTTARVLVIEDNRLNRELITTVIRRLGYEADGAASGEEGLIALERTHYDLILLDLQMPGMGGEATAHALHAQAGAPPRLVLLSAENNLADHPVAALCDAVLPKPIVWPDFTALLRRLLPLPPAVSE